MSCHLIGWAAQPPKTQLLNLTAFFWSFWLKPPVILPAFNHSALLSRYHVSTRGYPLDTLVDSWNHIEHLNYTTHQPLHIHLMLLVSHVLLHFSSSFANSVCLALLWFAMLCFIDCVSYNQVMPKFGIYSWKKMLCSYSTLCIPPWGCDIWIWFFLLMVSHLYLLFSFHHFSSSFNWNEVFFFLLIQWGQNASHPEDSWICPKCHVYQPYPCTFQYSRLKHWWTDIAWTCIIQLAPSNLWGAFHLPGMIPKLNELDLFG